MADSREFRSRFYVSSSAFVGILFGILVAFYFLGGFLTRVKVDLTEDGLFTISTPMVEILKDLKDEINARYYCSEKLPSQIANLKRDTVDLFRELEGLSGGHFKWEVVDPDVLADQDAAEKVREYYEKKQKGETPKEPQGQESFEDLFNNRSKTKRTDEQIAEERKKMAEARATATVKGGLTAEDHYRRLLTQEYKDIFRQDLQKQGIQEVVIPERSANQVSEISFYSSIEIKYLNKQSEVIPQHFHMQSLEYELASKVLKLTRSSKPKIVFFDSRKPDVPFNPSNPREQPPQSEYSGIIGALSELFDIDEVSLKENNSISDILKRIQDDLAKKDDDRPAEEKPTKISCLVVAQPSDLEARQVFEISKAVSEGIPTIFLVSNFSIDSSQGQQKQLPIVHLRHGLDDLFRSWGITLGKDVLVSRECNSFPLMQRHPLMGPVQMAYPLTILLESVGESINHEHGLTNRIQRLTFPASVGLTVIEEEAKKAGLQVTVLATSGKESKTVNVPMFKQNMFQQVEQPAVLKDKELYERRDLKPPFIAPKQLAVILEGKFPFKFQDQPVPDWKKEEKNAAAGGGPGGLPGGFNFPGLEMPKGPRGPAEDGVQLAQAPPAEEKTAAGEKKAEAAPQPSDPAAAPPAPAPAPAPAAPAAGTPATPARAPVTPAAVAPISPSPAPAPVAEAAKDETKKDEPKKDEPKKEPEKAKVELQNGRVIILTSSDMMKTDFLRLGGNYQPNVTFFYNAIETFGLDERLLKIRRKELTQRGFKTGAEDWETFIEWTNIAILPLAVGVFGLVRYLVRKRQSVAYEREYLQKKASGAA